MADSGVPKVLVIEDDPDVRENLCDILQLDGYRAESVATLAEARARDDWAEFAAVLVDRHLPDGVVDPLLSQIREHSPGAVLLMITGHSSTDGILAALRQGVTDYLVKPIDAGKLRSILAQAAGRREEEEARRRDERLAAIGRMLTALAHESANALQRTQNYLAVLAGRLQDQPECLEMIAGIRKAQNELRQLYEEVRGYAAPVKLQRQVHDLGALWREAWDEICSVHADKQPVLGEAHDAADLRCTVDGFRLKQVFRNLFENALAVCPTPARVEVRCTTTVHRGQPALRVAVRDNGPGLSLEQRRRAFEPFYTTKSRGTGLGLAIVRRIVETHGGCVAAMTPVGGGAEFVLLMPRGQADGGAGTG